MSKCTICVRDEGWTRVCLTEHKLGSSTTKQNQINEYAYIIVLISIFDFICISVCTVFVYTMFIPKRKIHLVYHVYCKTLIFQMSHVKIPQT